MEFRTSGRKSGTGRLTPSQILRHPVVKAMGVVAIALTVANCSQNQASIDKKYGVKASPRIVASGKPIPKGGGRNHVGKPYKIAGRTYVPQENPGYSAVGLASWYGAAFHGRLTANGEIFDRYSIAAAHPTMPLPSYARVTNLKNGHSMIVRVNDRGPFHANRVMDVSQAVAETLGFKNAGTAKVKVDYVGRASLSGSDDNALLATLRDDGMPAQLRTKTQPTMMAHAEPAPVAEETYAHTASEAPLHVQDEPVRVAMNIPLPPQRPFTLGQHMPDTNQMAVLYYTEPQQKPVVADGPFNMLSAKGFVSFKE